MVTTNLKREEYIDLSDLHEYYLNVCKKELPYPGEIEIRIYDQVLGNVDIIRLEPALALHKVSLIKKTK